MIAGSAGAGGEALSRIPPSPGPSVSTGAPFQRVDNEMSRYWHRRMADFAAEARDGRVPAGAVVFVGDSIIERFDLARFLPPAGGPYVNRGIGGDKVGGWRYWGVLDRLDASVLAHAPRQVVLMIGVNDIVFAATPPATLDAATAALVQRITDARVPLVVVSVLPAGDELGARVNPAIARFNGVLQALAERHGAGWLDLTGDFAGADGRLRRELAVDGLHLSDAGYARWAERIAPRLQPTAETRG